MDNHDNNTSNSAGDVSGAQNTDFLSESSINDVTDDNEGDGLAETITGSTGVLPSQSMDEVVDALMEDIVFVNMPPSEDVSNAEAVSNSDDDRDALEVEMQAVDAAGEVPSELPSIPSDIYGIPASSILASMPVLPRSNRRARVEDDDDEERDRRHPSQRRNNTSRTPVSSSTTAGTLSATAAPAHAQPGHATAVLNAPNPAHTVHQHIFPSGFPQAAFMQAIQQALPPIFAAVAPGPIPQNYAPNGGENNTNPEAAQQQNQETPANNTGNRPPTFAAFDGFAVSISMGEDGQPRISRRPLSPQERAVAGTFPMPNMAPGPGEPNAQNLPHLPPGGGGVGNFRFPPLDFASLAPMFVGIGGGGFEEREDPERAKKLVEGLDEVPEGLVKRLERVGGSGGGMGEDETRGGDGGCAICWDRLLPDGVQIADSLPVKAETQSESDTEKTEGNVATAEAGASASDATRVAEPSESKCPRIVSLPCAHVFHAECLIPWFSRPRHTTCPTCRFNIDPENLTYVSPMRRRQEQQQQQQQREAATQEPQPEENAQVTNGITLNPGPIIEGDPAQPTTVPREEAAPNVGANTENPRISQLPQNGVNPGLWFGNGATGFMGMGMMVSGPFPGVAPPPGPAMPPQPATTITTGDVPPAAATITTQTAPNPPPGNVPAGTGPQIQTEWIGTWTIPMHVGGAPQQGVGGAGLGAGFNGNPWRAVFNRPVHTHGPQQPLDPHPHNAANGPPPAVPNGGASAPTVDTPTPAPMNEGVAPPPNTVTVPWQVPSPNSPLPNPPATNATPALQLPPNHRQPRLSDLRVTIDVVFDGGPFPGDPPTATTDEDMPPLVPMGDMDLEGRIASPEEVAEQQQQFAQLFTLLDRNRRRWQDQERDRAAEPLGVPPPAAADGPAYGFNSEPQPELPFPIPRTLQASGPQQPLNEPAHQPHQPGQPLRTGPVPVQMPRNPNANQLPGLSGGRPGAIDVQGTSMGFNTFMAAARNGPADTDRQVGAPTADGEQSTVITPPQAPGQAQRQPTLPRMQNPFGWQMPIPFGLNPGNFMRPSGPAPPKRAWVLPTAPGPTLRQRIERREREAGLRCDDVSCGLGPSDEDPLSEDVADTIKKVHQLTIRSKDMGENGLRTSLCEHKFHSSCLVSAARVALRDADAVVNDDGSVDVSCPVCRHEGCMMHGEWDDGVKALE